eukprot:226638-Pyramimonas_sp.AAC.1
MMRRLRTKWNHHNMGLRLQPEDHDRLNNLRFADDLLLVATSPSDIGTMLADLSAEASVIGLTLHPDKTK